jgi:hypothetical protein
MFLPLLGFAGKVAELLFGHASACLFTSPLSAQIGPS